MQKEMGTHEEIMKIRIFEKEQETPCSRGTNNHDKRDPTTYRKKHPTLKENKLPMPIRQKSTQFK